MTGDTPPEARRRLEDRALDPERSRGDALAAALESAQAEHRELFARFEELQARAAVRERVHARRDAMVDELLAWKAAQERASAARARAMRTVLPAGLVALAAILLLALVISLGAVHGLFPWGTLLLGTATLGYCAGLLLVDHAPQLHSRRWHLALFVAIVPVGTGIGTCAAHQDGSFWLAICSAAATLFGVVYAIATSSRPAR